MTKCSDMYCTKVSHFPSFTRTKKKSDIVQNHTAIKDYTYINMMYIKYEGTTEERCAVGGLGPLYK